MLEKLFPNNEHVAERVIRVVVGIVLLSLIFVGPKTWFGLLGIVPLVTGLIGSCPLYTVLGISTCPMRNTGNPDGTPDKPVHPATQQR